MFRSKKAKAEDLMANGARGVGTIIDVRDTGMTINDNPRVKMTFQIEPLDGSPAFTARKRVRRCLCERSEIQLGQQFSETRPPCGRADIHRFQNGEDVLLDSESSEDRWLLGQIPDSLAGADVHRVVSHVVTIELHAPGIRGRQPNGHVEGRRLARAIWAEQADDLARCNLQVHAPDDCPAGV